MTVDDIDLIHHTFMEEYGWILLEEFKNLPLPALWGLWNRISEKRRKEQEDYDKMNNQSRRLRK